MNALPKKIVRDEHGVPVEVILSWNTFLEIANTLGYDPEMQAAVSMNPSTPSNFSKRDDLESEPKAYLKNGILVHHSGQQIQAEDVAAALAEE